MVEHLLEEHIGERTPGAGGDGGRLLVGYHNISNVYHLFLVPVYVVILMVVLVIQRIKHPVRGVHVHMRVSLVVKHHLDAAFL
jgi:hypothetical protein